uniref:Uncharacterized protein n=1 Tax=Knipowitschia caucasica TaxID=637954 RepID=A0AAV2KQR2_KNICA
MFGWCVGLVLVGSGVYGFLVVLCWVLGVVWFGGRELEGVGCWCVWGVRGGLVVLLVRVGGVVSVLELGGMRVWVFGSTDGAVYVSVSVCVVVRWRWWDCSDVGVGVGIVIVIVSCVVYVGGGFWSCGWVRRVFAGGGVGWWFCRVCLGFGEGCVLLIVDNGGMVGWLWGLVRWFAVCCSCVCWWSCFEILLVGLGWYVCGWCGCGSLVVCRWCGGGDAGGVLCFGFGMVTGIRVWLVVGWGVFGVVWGWVVWLLEGGWCGVVCVVVLVGGWGLLSFVFCVVWLWGCFGCCVGVYVEGGGVCWLVGGLCCVWGCVGGWVLWGGCVVWCDVVSLVVGVRFVGWGFVWVCGVCWLDIFGLGWLVGGCWFVVVVWMVRCGGGWGCSWGFGWFGVFILVFGLCGIVGGVWCGYWCVFVLVCGVFWLVVGVSWMGVSVGVGVWVWFCCNGFGGTGLMCVCVGAFGGCGLFYLVVCVWVFVGDVVWLVVVWFVWVLGVGVLLGSVVVCFVRVGWWCLWESGFFVWVCDSSSPPPLGFCVWCEVLLVGGCCVFFVCLGSDVGVLVGCFGPLCLRVVMLVLFVLVVVSVFCGGVMDLGVVAGWGCLVIGVVVWWGLWFVGAWMWWFIIFMVVGWVLVLCGWVVVRFWLSWLGWVFVEFMDEVVFCVVIGGCVGGFWFTWCWVCWWIGLGCLFGGCWGLVWGWGWGFVFLLVGGVVSWLWRVVWELDGAVWVCVGFDVVFELYVRFGL